MPDDLAEIRLTDVAVRWEGSGWTAYNVGRRPRYAAKAWSSSLGPCSEDDILTLFSNSAVMFLPPK